MPPSPTESAPPAGPPRLACTASGEAVLLAASVFFALAANGPFLAAALRGHDLAAPATWGFVAAVLVLLAAAHFVLLALVCNRWTLKPLLALLIVATAFGTFYMSRYGVFFDASMVRNVLRTNVAEARELLTPALLPHLLLYAALPLLLLWRVRLRRRPLVRATLLRIGWLLAGFAVAVAALLTVFQPFASLIRNQREVRHLITPGNMVFALGTVIARETRGATKPRQPIGLDARPGPGWATRSKPLLVVLVVGETARAANWGLDGYARQTTPELAALQGPEGLINFPDVTACGTNTETSLPCMFAPVGRRDYDEARIRGSESLLHVLARAGVGVTWRDNQSGCKGVCEGLPSQAVHDLGLPELCPGGRCLDEGLLHGLSDTLGHPQGMQLLVLHMLGNHGPSYYRRHPEAFARFQPECRSDDLHSCTREQIVNAYDNALLYTDEILARLIERLRSHATHLDSAVVFVSDHGESLGEKGLYLHGVPYAIAPEVQTRVPMVMWMSDGFATARALDLNCLRERATQPAAHDHLFHTLLGLLDVRTGLYEREWDLTAGCRAVPDPA